ncbi:hypothetical protein Glove_275g90 [Diversispora epigaea]|uniref:Protein kinase domain-containing protein n=1 Tax=Diversispora epigaea TaxID=1348612 RepID=A0A397IAD3_9GLOM|nr:hypothetical protein Glove_275g90 [Diversispora epigaea]
MSRETTSEKEWETLMDNLIIEDTMQKENIPFYQYSEFENLKLISRNVYEAIFKTSQKTVALKCVSLNDKFALDNLINEIKKHRKLEIHDSILKLYGITQQENTNNYMVIFEYANNGSLRQYLKTNLRKLDWNTKLNLAKQIANILMHLHSNDIIYGRLNSENILIHNGNIKLRVFGIAKTIPDSLRFLTNTGPIQYMDPQYLELFNITGKKSSDIFGLGIILWEISSGHPPFEMESSSNIDLLKNIAKGKREMTIPGTPQKYKEIYTDCWKHNGNSRPDISQVVKNLSEIVISDARVEFGTSQSQPYNVTDIKLENLNISDIFGLGIILWEISSGHPPFEMESSSNIDLLKNIAKGKREMTIPGTPQKYKEIYTDCWKHNGNSRPDISQVVKNLSEIVISDARVEFGTSQSQPYNVTDIKLENLNIQNEEPEIKPDHSFIDVTTEVNGFVNDLFEFFIDVRTKQVRMVQPIMIKKYIREYKKNPVKILYEMIRHPYHYLLTSLIGFFYQYGIGTVVDNQMAFKFFDLEIIETPSSNSSSLTKLYNSNKEINTISLANMYLNGTGVEKDTTKAFRIYQKLSNKESLIALNSVAFCYEYGLGVEKNEEKAFETYLKSAEKGYIVAQFNVGRCYVNGIGIEIDKTKGFQCCIKSARAGDINAMCNLGYYYFSGIGVDKDEKEAFKWYPKAAEKGLSMAQHNLGCCYETGYGIDRDEVKAFEWYKKAAENDYADSQYVIGECFYEGYGIKKDIINAIRWLNKAKENGNTYANELLEEIINNVM